MKQEMIDTLAELLKPVDGFISENEKSNHYKMTPEEQFEDAMLSVIMFQNRIMDISNDNQNLDVIVNYRNMAIDNIQEAFKYLLKEIERNGNNGR